MDTLTDEPEESSEPKSLEGAGSGRRSTLRQGLRHFFLDRHFALLWSAQTISSFGSHITGIGLPIAALLLLRATSAQMGLLTALAALPGLVAGLLIGIWVDRLPRRLVLIAMDLGRALLLALIPLLAAFGWLHLAWLYLITALAGLCTAAFEVASLAFLPTLLPPAKLPTGNSRLSTSESLAEIAGPPLAGLLIQLLTAPLAILLDALSFLCSALCIGLMRAPERARPAHVEHTHLWREMREGLEVFWNNPILRALGAYACTRTFFGGAFAALYLIYVVQLFGASSLAYGILVACGGVGALIGSLGANWWTRRATPGRTLIVSALLFALLSFCTPLASGPMPFAFALMAFSQLFGDAGFAIYSIYEISLRQTIVPKRLLGRVNACMHMLSEGAMPLGALLAGLLSEFIGIRLTLLVGSGGMLLACAWLLFSPLHRTGDRMEKKPRKSTGKNTLSPGKSDEHVKIETCSDGRKGEKEHVRRPV